MRWGILHPSRLWDGGATADPPDALPASWLTANPWLDALRAAGRSPRFDARALPVDEGESSLNLNGHQALASVLASVLGLERGAPPLVLGSVAFGNHALRHTMVRWAKSFADPAAALSAYEALVTGLGPRDAVSAVLAGPGARGLHGEIRRHPRLLDRRITRFPPLRFELPPIDRLRSFLDTAGVSPRGRVAATLSAAHEAVRGVGLSTFADFILVARAALVHEVAALLDVGPIGHVPLPLEALLGGEPAVGERSLVDLARDQHACARAHLDTQPPVARRGAPTYRVLNHFDPDRLLLESEKSALGRRSDEAWETLEAAWDDATLVDDPGALGGRSVASLLTRGYGLSGKLTYHAAACLAGGRVCNLLLRTPKTDVLAPFAVPHPRHRVLPLERVTVIGAWTPAPSSLDLIPLLDWIDRSADPPGLLRRVFDAYRRAALSEAGGVVVLRGQDEVELRLSSPPCA